MTLKVILWFEKAEHTFASFAEKELAKLAQNAPAIEKTIGTVLTYVGPALQTIVTVTAGAPAGAVIGKVIGQAQSDLIAASGLVHDFGATPTVGSILQSVSQNLSALLTAGHITDTQSVATANKVVAEINAIANVLIPQAQISTDPALNPSPVPVAQRPTSDN